MSAGFTEGYNQLCPNLFKSCLFGVFLGQPMDEIYKYHDL